MARAKKNGHNPNVMDVLIAAIAAENGMAIATLNRKDFERLGVSVKTSLPDQLVAKATLELEHLPDASESEADSEDAAFVEITSGSKGA